MPIALAFFVVAVLLVIGNPLTSSPATALLIGAVRRRQAASHRAGSWLRQENGSVLVEVMVGTLLLAMTTAAVLDGMDGTQQIARKNKDRSTAATLAQQDLERLRALPPTVLASLDQTRTVSVAGVPYTVRSRTEWVRDASGLVSCTSDETEAEYLKLSSTAYAPASADTPVTATSLLTPPPGAFGESTGTAAVKVTDRDGLPLADVQVALDGPSTQTATTNELGCAIFAFIPAGDWIAEVDDGLVTWSGDSPAQSAITVAEGKTSLTQIELDEPGSLRATFQAPDGTPVSWATTSVTNAKLPGGLKTFAATTPSTSQDIENLFPFHDGYGVFAGACDANNPAVWDPDYYATSGYGFAAFAPGAFLEPVDVVVPQLEVKARRSNDSAFTDVRVVVTQDDVEHECTAVAFDSKTVSGSYASYTFHIPLPFGHYEVCAAIRASGTWRRKYTGTSGMPASPDLTEEPLAQSITMSIPTSGSSGQCP